MFEGLAMTRYLCTVVLIFYDCITSDHKFSILKQHPFIVSQVCDSEVHYGMGAFSAWFILHGGIQVSAGLRVHLRLYGCVCFQSCSYYWQNLDPFGGRAEVPVASCHPGACLQLLKTAHAPCHMGPFVLELPVQGRVPMLRNSDLLCD